MVPGSIWLFHVIVACLSHCTGSSLRAGPLTCLLLYHHTGNNAQYIGGAHRMEQMNGSHCAVLFKVKGRLAYWLECSGRASQYTRCEGVWLWGISRTGCGFSLKRIRIFCRALDVLEGRWVLEPKRSRFKFGLFHLTSFVTLRSLSFSFFTHKMRLILLSLFWGIKVLSYIKHAA